MADYTRQRQQAVRMIKAKGTTGVLTHTVYVENAAEPWKAGTIEVETTVDCLVFPDDGETFVNHNISENARIALVAPTPELTQISTGDKLLVGTELLNINLIKSLNPDNSGVILWTLLVT